MIADTIARITVTLDDVAPKVQRRIEVPLTIRLDRLHLTLQAALGWTNSHLYELRARDAGWGVPHDWGDGPHDARKARLIDVLEDTGVKTLRYLYDFGDGWEHKLKIDRIAVATPGEVYPRLIDATGRCPPEDIGGPWGYADLLAAKADPNHERYAEFAEWMDVDAFDPNEVDVLILARRVGALASSWNRKPPVRKTPTR